MADEPTVREVSNKVDHLEDEQARLKKEQEKLRESAGAGNPPKPPQQGAGDQQAQQAQQEKKPPEPPKKPFAQRTRRYLRRHPGRVLLGAVALVVLAVGSVLLWNYLSSYESTDDAQVDGHLNMISPRIRGTVVGVYVENDQFVKAGQVIVDLDPRDYQVALQQAGGAYAQAVAQLHAENPNVPIIVTTNRDHHFGRTSRCHGGRKGGVGGAAGVSGKAGGSAERRSAEAKNAAGCGSAISRWRIRRRFRGNSSTRFAPPPRARRRRVDAAKAAVQVALRDTG